MFLAEHTGIIGGRLKAKNVESVGRVRAIRDHAGFSLIEVLVAMTVLIIVIIMVSNMFRDASEACDAGGQRAEMNTAARAAVDYIARELSCAMAGSISDLGGATRPVKRFKLENAMVDGIGQTINLSFTALSGESDAPRRVLRGVRIRYYDHNIQACRFDDIGSFHPYESTDWSGWPETNSIITNVWRFEVNVYSNESQMAAGAIGWNYDSRDNSDLLPACVDIAIEILGERDMMRALSLQAGGTDPARFVMVNSRVYTTRVCFSNRGRGGR